MITKIIKEDLIQKAKEEIESVNDIVIVSHVSPDGDAVGSSLGFYNFLTDILDKNVTVIVPTEVPDYFRWMPGASDMLVYSEDKELCDEKIKNAELIFALDFNNLKRIGDMAFVVADAPAKKILVDHHLDPGNFANVIISYPDISSTSEMIFRLICRMGYFTDMTQECAECIYTGMMTDTGCFTYNSNQTEIYLIISELIKKGIDKDEIHRRVYDNYSENRFRMMGYLLSEKMKVYPEYGTAMMYLTKEELKRFDYKPGDIEGFVNMPMSIKGVVFSALFREDESKIRVSFRSQGDVAVNEFAAEYFDGGGHKNAAGGQLFIPMDEAIRMFEEKLPTLADSLKKEIEKQSKY
ncbi:MAG: bifunctional oligoribonuclease/PAP phosphatase NrnA [Bacteroidales bacterium]|nr:bifunctional oligoribonuclease/PAP phosphatase NrnA [Bacteroidales bacterium]